MENYLDELPDLEDEITETRLVECVREQVKKDIPHASSFFVGGIFQLRHVFAHGIIHLDSQILMGMTGNTRGLKWPVEHNLGQVVTQDRGP